MSNVYRCRLCPYFTTNFVNLKRHLRNKHDRRQQDDLEEPNIPQLYREMQPQRDTIVEDEMVIVMEEQEGEPEPSPLQIAVMFAIQWMKISSLPKKNKSS